MFSRDLFLRLFGAVLVAVAALVALPSTSLAQDEEAEEAAEAEEEEASEPAADEDDADAAESAVVAPVGRTGSGAPAESWIAMGIALGLGAATIAVGGIVGRLALDENAVALDGGTTQLAAQAHHRTAMDYALASTVTLTVGAIIFGIGTVWAIILPFSTPPGTLVRATITPSSIGLEGTF